MNELTSGKAETLITLTSEIVAAHVSNNSVSVDEMTALISNVYSALTNLEGEGAQIEDRPDPVVSVRASVKKDHIVCLDCGKKMKVLKRHLSAEHGMTPNEYRQRWDLGPDYPMVAPNYAATRSDMAKKLGLGRKPGEKRVTKRARK